MRTQANFIWSNVDLLRGPYKPHQYGAVVLPFSILRRLDRVLERTKQAVRRGDQARHPAVGIRISYEGIGYRFFLHVGVHPEVADGRPASINANLIDYVHGFSENVCDIFERFEFEKQFEKLDSDNLLYLVTQRFAGIDLHPQKVSNIEMA